jgi:hypothetical protein
MIGKCHQRKIRESHQDDHPVPTDFSTASVREIPYAEAKAFILKYEWLGNMGTTVRTFGLFFGDELAAVECFGHPGSEPIKNLCGRENADKVYWLARGACAHWAHEHSSSYLINKACELMGAPWKTRDGKDMPAKFVFVATADTDAGEIGTCYQASNWVYIGKTTSDRMFNKPGAPPERAKSYRVLVKGPIRNRSKRIQHADEDGRRHFLIDGQKYYYGDITPAGEYIGGSPQYPLRWNAKYGKEAKQAEKARLAEILAEGWVEVKGNAKHMYVGIYGDKRLRRTLKERLIATQFPKKKGLVCSACLAPVKFGERQQDGKTVEWFFHVKDADCKKKVDPKMPYPKRGSVEGNSAGTPSDSGVRSSNPAPTSSEITPSTIAQSAG